MHETLDHPHRRSRRRKNNSMPRPEASSAIDGGSGTGAEETMSPSKLRVT
jgi:hypothetical protein